MGLVLQIDTSRETASISISLDGNLIVSKENNNQKDHAAFVQPEIKNICLEQNISLKDFNAIAVVSGPGSYTGLRVGMASAKGLCFALEIPLIMINTLECMALSSIICCARDNKLMEKTNLIYCPMIDARRSEVYTAVYDQQLDLIFRPSPVILDPLSFKDLFNQHTVIFSGSGAAKFITMLQHQNFYKTGESMDCIALSVLSGAALATEVFANLAYAEPEYLKTFFTTGSAGSG